MYSELTTRVIDILFENETIQQIKTDKGAKKALLYKQITKRVSKGDVVVVNTTATELKLGTGGWDIVRYVLSKEHNSPINKGSGHIMKARYTPVQHSVLTVEEKNSPYHHLFHRSFSLNGKYVILAELHSMVPLIYYVSQQIKKGARCSVIFDDQASLVLSMSAHLHELHKEPFFTSITVGQAFGGQFEAVTVASALQFADLVIKPDIIVISVGPGVVGTGTKYGFSGMNMAHWSHTVSALNGVPIWIPRLSFSDKRKRHYGLSHHTLTPLATFTFKKAVVAFPYMDKTEKEMIKNQIANETFQTKHDIRFATTNEAKEYVENALKNAPLPIETMGRNYDEDRLFFLAVAEAVRIVLLTKQ